MKENTKESPRAALIFGGAGFIGSNWAARLLQTTAASIHVFDNLSRPGVRHNLEWLQGLSSGSGRLHISVADVRDRLAVERAVRAATEIYHFAAQVAVTRSLLDPQLDFEVNLMGTMNVLEATRKAGHQPFLLFTSSNKVYGEMSERALVKTRSRYQLADPRGVSESQPLDFRSPYGCSKGAADQYVRDYARSFAIPSTVLRMSCIAGPRQFGSEDQGWVAHLVYCALRGQTVVLYGDGRQVRDVLDVEDLLRAIELVRASLPTTRGQVYNIGGGVENAVSLLELIAEVQRLTGRRLRYVLDEPRSGDQLVYVSDYSKLWRDTGWRPQTSVRETLKRIWQWWNSHAAEPCWPATSATVEEARGVA